MVRESLSDFSIQKNTIVYAISNKISNGLYAQTLHDSFKPSNFNITDIENIINSIESKLRKVEIIYFTYFYSEYERSIIVNDSMTSNKIIETEFFFSTNVLKNRIEINDSKLYKECIDTNFQTFILTISSIYEVLVKLIETLLKKIVLYDGNRVPYQSITLKLLIQNWDKLVYLKYRNNDDFYNWRNTHRQFLDKYLETINMLRNRFIHGYSSHLDNKNYNTYIITKYEENQPNSNSTTGFQKPQNGGLILELEVDTFVKDVLNNTTIVIVELLDLFVKKLSHHKTKIPM